MIENIIIGTRGSPLALAQANIVISLLRKKYPNINVKVKIIKTSGDIHQEHILAGIGGKGLFVKEIEEALMRGEIDVAAHSMKDLPIELPDSLEIAAIPEREDARDAFACKNTNGWDTLPSGSVIGTSSLRRVSQLKYLKPQWVTKELRGNIDTRWKKLEHGDYDGIIIAMAGVKRLKLMSEYILPLDPYEFIPAIGQGALALEVNKNKEEVFELISGLNHLMSSVSVRAERAFLKKLGGGCHSSLGAYATIKDDYLEIIGFVASPDGKKMIKEVYGSETESPEEVGFALAEVLLSKGAKELLDIK